MKVNRKFIVASAILVVLYYVYTKEEPKKETYCTMCAGK